MSGKLINAHKALWQAYDLMTESHRKRVELRARLVDECANQLLSIGKAPDINLSFADSQEAAFLEAEIFEAVIAELSCRHRAALAEQICMDLEAITVAREAKQTERLLATEQKQEMRIDADIQTLSSKLRDCHPIRELHATPDGLMQATREDPFVPANPLELEKLLSGKDKAVAIRIAFESDGQCRLWAGSFYKR